MRKIRLPTPSSRESPPEVIARGERLRPYRGQFVAEKGDEVLFAAAQPHEVMAWLRARGVELASVMFVPVDPDADVPHPR